MAGKPVDCLELSGIQLFEVLVSSITYGLVTLIT